MNFMASCSHRLGYREKLWGIVVLGLLVFISSFLSSSWLGVSRESQHVLFWSNSVVSSSEGPFIWPAPRYARHGKLTLTLSGTFKITSSAPKKFKILHKALHRYSKLILSRAEARDNSQASQASSKFLLHELRVKLSSLNETLQLGVNESYSLQLPDPSNPSIAVLQAETVYGALRGLETFSQLCSYDAFSRNIHVQNCPWDIADEPRFAYRGLLIDTSRHHLPLEVIRDVLDSMSYAKLNVLHWHIVDEQSFPLEIPSFPNLWYGSYSSRERYTIDDVRGVVRYARLRGINVMPEIDVPGHAQSWGTGYPKLWPSSRCKMPLDVSNEFTFQVIEGIISDLSKVFPFKLFHLGGDEVDPACWYHTKRVSTWLQERNMTAEQGYEYFVLRVQKLAMKYGYTPVNWQETFKHFGASLHRETIVHNWWGLEVAPAVVKAGLRCIVSEQASWYLDHVNTPWERFYTYEPFQNITEEQERKLILGTEVCMWGEQVDASNIQQTIWPRAAAAAERFWSPQNFTSFTPESKRHLTKRLENFRCLLNERGVAAAPVHVPGRGSPQDTSSCYRESNPVEQHQDTKSSSAFQEDSTKPQAVDFKVPSNSSTVPTQLET